ncbi:MAG: alpha/beta fold hydrolase [Pseudomonadota bacterium]
MFNPITEFKRRIAMRQMAKFFSRVERNPVTRTPKDIDLAYEDVSFKTEDGVTLKAWFIPAEGSRKLVIFNHFMLGNRAGAVPDPDWGNVTVDFMPIYRALVKAGYSVLTYDLRNHGESDVYKDGALGLTHTEYRDILASVRYAKQHYAESELYLYSQCYGTIATMRAMEKSPEDFDGVRAFVNIQPLSADAFVQGVTGKFGISHPGNVDLFSHHLEKRTGYKVSQCLAPDLAPSVKTPTLLVQVHDDWRTEASDIEQVYDRLATTDKKLLWIEGEDERLEGYNYFARNPKELIDWLDAH